MQEMVEIEHFSHDHPLVLKAEEMDDRSLVVCYGCQKPIPGLSYGCRGCMHFLHISCAQIPHQLLHPSHFQHPLYLRPNARNSSLTETWCDVCQVRCNRFIYSCKSCDFDVDINCAFMAINASKRISHKSHEHELMPLEKLITLTCDACGTKHQEEDTSYICTTCGFWISRKCASLPTTISISRSSDNSDKIDLLTLWYTTPADIYYHPLHCKICEKFISRTFWVYYHHSINKSEEYFVHLHCATPLIKQSPRNDIIETELNDLGLTLADLSNNSTTTTPNEGLELNVMIMLPIPDIHVNITTQYLLLVQGKYERKEEVQHFSHPHLLILTDEKVDLSVHIRCDLCREVILLAPFYRCSASCKFFLHETCAKLPKEVQSPCHPEHSLFLSSAKELWSVMSIGQPEPFQCACCKLYYDKNFYACSDCNFNLDPKCAFLPRAMKHEAHQHTLAPRKVTFEVHCSACQSRRNILFLCDLCRFGICIWCAILPRVVKHRYDEHTFSLKYVLPMREFPDEDFCEICLEGISSQEWFYECEKCDQSLHTKCIRPIDTFGNLLTVSLTTRPFHRGHCLHLAPTPKRPSPCTDCGNLVLSHSFKALYCITCDSWMHEDCYLYR